MSHRRQPPGPDQGPDEAPDQGPNRSLSHSAGAERGEIVPPRAALYFERLRVPAGWWLLAVPVVAVLGGYALYAGYRGLIAIGVYAALTAFVAGFLLAWSAATIEVADGVLRAGRDTLALSDAAEVIALDAEQSALLRGPRADPAAHLLLRPYLKRAVFVRLADAAAGQAAGVPYWLVATRHPETLAAAIEAGRQAARPETQQRVG